MKSFRGQEFKKGVIGGEGGNGRSSIIKLSVLEGGGTVLFIRCHHAKIASEVHQLQRKRGSERERCSMSHLDFYCVCVCV